MELGLNSSRSVYLLDGPGIEHYWRDIVDGLKSTPFFDRYGELWTYQQAQENRLQIWLFMDGADKINVVMVTQVQEFPLKKVLTVLALFGKQLEESVEQIEILLDKLAKMQDCSEIDALCRPGFERKLKSFHVWKRGVLLSRAVGRVTEN